MACFQETKATDDQRPVTDYAGHKKPMGNPGSPLDFSETDMLAEARVPKARKPYMITKQREKWSEDEHNLFLEALQLHGRSWRRIQEHIGTKTAVQIRSHAQKFFTKVIRESSGDNSNSSGAAPPIQIPPPRPKRKSVHPYPCNLRKASGKHGHALPQLEKSQLQTQSLCEQENGSPRSELTTSHMDSETFSSDSDGSPASTTDVEERCPTPSMATAELAVRVPPVNVKDTKCNTTTSEEEGCDRSKVPILKLFGKRVMVVNDSHQQQNPESVAEMEVDASEETPTSGTGKFSSHGAAEANTWSPWPENVQQFMYYLPPGAVFFSYNDGSTPCPMMTNPMAAASDQQQHLQHSEVVEKNLMRGESSWAEPNTASCSVPETTVQNSESTESYTQANGSEDNRVPVSGLRKYVTPASTSQRGFMPYKRCAAESTVRPWLVSGEEADGEMTRLCL